MTDAELVYNACLRAERRVEFDMLPGATEDARELRASLLAIQTIRDEIGNGLAGRRLRGESQ